MEMAYALAGALVVIEGFVYGVQMLLHLFGRVAR